jgi:hypothetical protein
LADASAFRIGIRSFQALRGTASGCNGMRLMDGRKRLARSGQIANGDGTARNDSGSRKNGRCGTGMHQMLLYTKPKNHDWALGRLRMVRGSILIETFRCGIQQPKR